MHLLTVPRLNSVTPVFYWFFLLGCDGLLSRLYVAAGERFEAVMCQW